MRTQATRPGLSSSSCCPQAQRMGRRYAQGMRTVAKASPESGTVAEARPCAGRRAESGLKKAEDGDPQVAGLTSGKFSAAWPASAAVSKQRRRHPFPRSFPTTPVSAEVCSEARADGEETHAPRPPSQPSPQGSVLRAAATESPYETVRKGLMAEKSQAQETGEESKNWEGDAIDPSWQASAWAQQQRRQHPFPRAFTGDPDTPAPAEKPVSTSDSAPASEPQSTENGQHPEPDRAEVTVPAKRQLFRASAWMGSQRQAKPFPRGFIPNAAETVPPSDAEESAAPPRETANSGASDPLQSLATEDGVTAAAGAATADVSVSRWRKLMATAGGSMDIVAAEEAEGFSNVADIIKSLRKGVESRDAELAGAKKEMQDAWDALAQAKASVRRTRLAAMVFQLGRQIGRDLHFVRDAGSGAFADVAFAMDANSGQQLAIKLSVDEDNRSLLQREATALSYLNGLPGSHSHVVQLLGPYTEFQMGLDEGGPSTVGALLLEKADCDLESFVVQRFRESRDLFAVACAIDKWEESTRWLHDNGILHLDMKAENAIYFAGDGPESAAVKIIDLTGILTRRHILPPNDGLEAKDLRWKTTDLEGLNIPYVSTALYTQPTEAREARLGPKILDYSADWWSVGVSKLEIFGLQPEVFADNNTSALLYNLLTTGKLEALVREELRGKMAGVNVHEDVVSALVASILSNLNGSPAGGKLAQAGGPTADE